jgi:hypothetical protein
MLQACEKKLLAIVNVAFYTPRSAKSAGLYLHNFRAALSSRDLW